MHTLMAAESLHAGSWTSRVEHEVGMVWHPRYASPTATAQNDPDSNARPSSHHLGGINNVAFADSHARGLHKDIDYRVYSQLLTTNGAEAKYADTLTPVPAEFRQPLKEGDY
jgi:prepilin-type processing-associated H-X9-DG protein